MDHRRRPDAQTDRDASCRHRHIYVPPGCLWMYHPRCGWTDSGLALYMGQRLQHVGRQTELYQAYLCKRPVENDRSYPGDLDGLEYHSLYRQAWQYVWLRLQLLW